MATRSTGNSHSRLLPRVGLLFLLTVLWSGLSQYAQSQSPTPTFKSSMEMITIPAGKFIMGSSEEDITRAAQKFFSESLEYYRDETPARTIHLDAYAIDQTEVTVAQYTRYRNSRNLPAPKFSDDPNLNGPTQPVVGVTWTEAAEYCSAQGKRLPTEAEWEKAVRGSEGLIYPWGNEPDKSKANVRGKKDGFRYSAPVGSFPEGANKQGVLDLAGNVWEWTADWYQPHPGNTHPNDHYGKQYKVIKGGSWFSNWDLARATVRGKTRPDQRRKYIGFRCVR